MVWAEIQIAGGWRLVLGQEFPQMEEWVQGFAPASVVLLVLVFLWVELWEQPLFPENQ